MRETDPVKIKALRKARKEAGSLISGKPKTKLGKKRFRKYKREEAKRILKGENPRESLSAKKIKKEDLIAIISKEKKEK